MHKFITAPLHEVIDVEPKGRVQYFLDNPIINPEKSDQFNIGNLVVFNDKVFHGYYVPYYDDYRNHIFMVVDISNNHIALVCVDDESVVVNGMVHHNELEAFQLTYNQCIKIYHDIIDVFKANSKNNYRLKDGVIIDKVLTQKLMSELTDSKNNLMKLKTSNKITQNHILKFVGQMDIVISSLHPNVNDRYDDKRYYLQILSIVSSMDLNSINDVLDKVEQSFFNV